METFESIACILVIVLILAIIAFGLICLLWHMTVHQYCKYKLYQSKNRIQWRCCETTKSIELRKTGERDDFTCYLEYRILPSSVSKFVRIFGENNWKEAFDHYKNFKNKEEFKKYVSNWETYGEVREHIEGKNGITWYEPEDE